MKNEIIGYHGGGYDGCFWEPNFLYFDENGICHDLYSSGYAGAFKDKKLVAEINELWLDEHKAGIYPLTQAGIDRMLKVYREDFIVGIVKKLNRNPKLDFSILCSKCKRYEQPDNVHFEGYKGDGGIGIIQEGVICECCYSEGCCMDCGEYHGDLPDGLCDWCKGKIKKNHPEIEELENVIAKGKEQLMIICELMPDKANRFTKQHNKNVADIEDEISRIYRS